MKVRQKAVYDAVLYEDGMEDGFLTPKGNFWPTDKKDEMYEWVGRDTHYTPVLRSGSGGYEFIYAGDWILTDEKGRRSRIAPTAFEQYWEAVDSPN